jgi:hypothetical protein
MHNLKLNHIEKNNNHNQTGSAAASTKEIKQTIICGIGFF